MDISIKCGLTAAELPEEKVEAIRASPMDPRNAHLDKMLDPKSRTRRPTRTRPGLVISYASLRHHGRATR
jgi:hypothetical protein